MTVRFIRSSEKRKIEEQLEEQFGITKLPYLLLETGKEKVRGFSGSLSKEEIMKLKDLTRIEILGIYLIKQEHDLRLSFDATQILKNQITKNILVVNDQEFYDWIRGKDLDKEMPQATYVIQYNGDFYGCGKSNGKKIFNYVPKDRRIRRN